jgi:hypothetical protein
VGEERSRPARHHIFTLHKVNRGHERVVAVRLATAGRQKIEGVVSRHPH